MFKQPPPAPNASAVGPCPTVIQIVGRPGTGSLPSSIAPPDHPLAFLYVFFLDLFRRFRSLGIRGWSGGAKVLGKLPVPGRPTILIIVGQGPTALAVGAGGGGLDILLSSILSLLGMVGWCDGAG